MRSYNSSLDYDRSVMILPSMRPSMTTTQQQPSNFDSLTLLPSFFPKNKQPSSYDQPGSKHREVIEIIEPDLEDFGDYKLTKKVKPDSNSVNKTVYPNVQNKNQSGPIYPQDPRQYNHRPDFAPRPVDKPNVQIIELDESDDDVEDHNNRRVLNSQEKINRQKPINISINDSNNVTQGNGHHPYHYQNIAGYSMPKRPLLSHHEIFSDTPLSPSNSDSSSSAFYSPTNHEFLAELNSRVDEQPLTPSRPQETQGTSLNAKRVFGYDQGEFSPKVKVVERIDLDEDDAIVISECESDEEDYQQTECTYIGLESRHVSVVDSVVSKPSQQEDKLKPLGAILSPLQTEEKQIQIKIKTSQEKSKKLAKKRQVKQKEAGKEGSKTSKEVKPSSLPTKKKVKKTQTQLLLSENADPSYKKTSRGLNKLQLFRYQMDVVIDEAEALDKISFFESEAKPEQLLKITKSDSKKDLYTDQVATIPPLDKRVNNKRKGPLVPLWDPQGVKENELNDYLKQLKQIVRETIIDEERAFRLLKVFNLSTKLTMDEVKTNMTYYKEILTQRFRKFKRRIS